MKTCHSLLSAVFVFLLCFAGTAAGGDGTLTFVLPTPAFTFTYTTANGAATIWGWQAARGTLLTLPLSVVIPSFIDGYPVTRIEDDAFSGEGFYQMTIPSSVTSIGSRAFKNCSSLSSIVFKGNAPTLGADVFLGTSAYPWVTATITYPSAATGWGATYGDLTTVADYSDVLTCTTNADHTFVTIMGYTGAGGILVIPASIDKLPVTTIGDHAFQGCSGLTSVTIPDSVTRIGTRSFQGCSGLTSVTIPNSVTRIGTQAFQGCNGLTSLTVPDSVIRIGTQSFQNCSGLTSATIGSGVAHIGAGAFDSCSGLNKITFKGNAPTLGDDAFSGVTAFVTYPCAAKGWDVSFGGLLKVADYTSSSSGGLTTVADNVDGCTYTISTDRTSITITGYVGEGGAVVIPSSISGRPVTAIASGAFQNSNSLTSLTIPSSVKSIGDNAFSGCFGLTSLTIPTSVTRIGSGTFENCSSLTSVTIPDGVTSIGDFAFASCVGLTSLTIPKGVTRIGDGVFQDCSGLTNIVFKGNAPALGLDAFSGVTATITYPSAATGWSASFGGSTAVADYTDVWAYTTSENNSAVTITSYTGRGGAVVIPSSIDGLPVTRIGDNAFSGCTGLTGVRFNPLSSRVGNQFQFNFSKFGISGAMKLVGALPTGLSFNTKTGILSGKITGKAGSYPLILQFLSGTVTRTITLPLNVASYPSGLAGTFQGLLDASGTGMPSGMVSLAVTPGTWTATLDLAGSSKVLSAMGIFSLDPTQEAVDLTIPFSTAMTVHLHLDSNSSLVSGDYPQGSIAGFRMASGSELPTSNQLFTLSLDQDAQDGMTIPAGMGWATGTVSNKGAIALTGQLGDGKAFKLATQLSATGQAIVWMKPYSNPNSLVGGIVSLRDRGLVKNGPDEPLTEGLSWYRVPDAKELSYPNGFGPLQVDAGVAPYSVPANAAALATSIGHPTASPITFPCLIIDGGGLPNTIAASLPTSLTLDNAFKLKAAPTLLPWTGTVNKANGSFSGTLTLPASTSDVLAGAATVSGVLLEESYYSPHVGSGLVKIPLKSPKGSFRTAAMVISGEAP